MLSVIAAKLGDKNFNKWGFMVEFFLAQFVLFSLLNLAAATVYSVFREIQPILLLIAAVLTFLLATSIYMNKPLPLPTVGGIYGLALSPCSVGFAVATAASSTNYPLAIVNALFFSIGILTPIVVIVFLLQSVEPFIKKSYLIEKLGIVLLYLVSFYLAYLSGSSWRWIP